MFFLNFNRDLFFRANIFKKIQFLFFSVYAYLIFFLNAGISFIFGKERCIKCGKARTILPLCIDCAKNFFGISQNRKNENRCSICGRFLISENGICSECKNFRVLHSTKSVFSLQTYSLWKKELLFAWKIEEKRALTPFFAYSIFLQIQQMEKTENCALPVVPVPPRPGKIQQKGWDQIEDLCFYLKNGFGIEILPLLERSTKKQQKKLDRIQRLEMIGKAYFSKEEKKIKKICKKIPKKAILLDDVLTTGATIENCAAELKKIGVDEVFAVTIFIV